MDIIIEFLLKFIIFMTGACIFSFSFCRFIEIKRIELPLIRLLDKSSIINTKAAKKKCYINLAIQLILFVGFAVFMAFFYSIIGIWVSIFITACSISETAPNRENKLKWLQDNRMFINGDLEEAKTIVLSYKDEE